ncbi:Hpt domain-containing protein [uncultured Nonlabens sp.]|uniref:Hpt domain-containing protein n=1 Tax=uncultured Nonlabens sp. TaxID=859306 RepID=UPI00261BC38F|nr:Hpt domain-containing protein [uncultured Nonlabens sp.]
MKQVSYDLTNVIAMSDNDSDFVKLMVHTFIKDIPRDLERLAVAVSEQDRAGVHRYAHRIKPTLELFGIESFKHAAALELWGKGELEKDIKKDFLILNLDLSEILTQLKRDF